MAQAVTGPIGFLVSADFCRDVCLRQSGGHLYGLSQSSIWSRAYDRQSIAAAGGVFAYIGVLIVVIQGGFIRPLVKKYGEARLVVVGIGLMALGFLCFPLAPLLSILLLGPMVPISLGSGLNAPSLRALVSRRATAQGAALGFRRRLTVLRGRPAPPLPGIFTKMSARPRLTGARGS